MTRCVSCGAKILWVEDQKGTKIPLNFVPRVRGYTVLGLEKAEFETDATGAPRLFYISHFLTCPNASAHSKKKARNE